MRAGLSNGGADIGPRGPPLTRDAQGREGARDDQAQTGLHTEVEQRIPYLSSGERVPRQSPANPRS